MNEQSRIIGIDLGTTNSVVAITIGSDPVVIPNTEGSNKTPSVVAFMDNGEVVVGEIARRQASTNPTRTISSIKRLMGRTIEDVQEAGDVFPYSVVSHEGELLVDIDGMGYRPEQVSALVIKKLKEAAEAYLGEEVTQAVITVPAHFDDIQRQATIDAATMAHLNVLRLINEPTAAAMAYGLGRSDSAKDETVVVYDFGGGTFDVSILEISGKTFEVLTCTGDSHLGGDDLDNAIVSLVVAEFQEEYGMDLTADPVTLRRLKEVAERAKIELSSTNQANLALPFITYQNGQPLHLDRVLTRSEFEELAEEAVRRTIRCCKRALEEAGLTKKDIGRVIMVGGTTRIPMVQDAVEEFFDQQIFRGVNPDEVVALGAATQAGVFEGNVQEVILLDVCPHSLGIEVEGGKFSKIIEKNATIPIKAAKTFTTTEPNQAFVNIHVLQGESEEAAENRSLGKFALTGIPPAPAGVPRIRVTFFINSDGVMEISAEDMSTGAAQTIKIVHSQLSDEEKNRRQRKRARSQGKMAPSARRAAARKGGTGGLKKTGSSLSGTGGLGASPVPSSQGGPTLGGRSLPQRPPTQSLPPSSQSGGGFAAPAPPAAVPAPLAEKSDSQTQQRFAVLGDAAPSSMAMPGVRSREALMTNTPEPLAPVDYSKAPPTYSPVAAPPAPAPAPSPAPVPLNPAAMADREPSSAMPAAPISSYPALGPTPTRPTTQTPSQAPAWHSDQTVPEIPFELGEAVRMAESGRDDVDAQRVYLNALGSLQKGGLVNVETFDLLRARTLLQYLTGQLEETRLTLQRLRDRYATSRPQEVLELHEKALTRFGAPSLLRDRARLRALLGDLTNACADFEQAMRDEPAADDAAELENLYRQRTTNGDDPQAMFKLVKLLLKGNKVDEAIAILQVLQNHKGYEQRALKILGLCHWQKNMHYLAWQKFKTLPIDEDLKDILYRLAGDMEASDQLQNAVAVLEHLVANAAGFRDAEARLRKLQYRLKLQKEEQEAPREVPVLSKDSRFVILQEINRGSMGIIYKAQDKTLNEVVALKVLNDYLCSDPAAVERFKSEARAAKRLSHPYIVRIHDMFENDTKRFISMEYIEGQDLKRMIAEKTTFNEEQILYYFVQICDALSYAHKLGIVHRDIKPANIMITNRNAVKITDFGIAKILRGDDATKSGTAVIGTPLYMAPEQIIGDSVDGRTDIYSLGIMMYEMLNGNPPFYLGNIEYHHIHTAPPPLNERISPRVRDAIGRMIAKKPEDRFQTVEEIVPFIKAT